MSVLYFSDTSGNITGDNTLNAVAARNQENLVSATLQGELRVFVDPRWLNQKLGTFNDSTDSWSNNDIDITLDELINHINQTGTSTVEGQNVLVDVQAAVGSGNDAGQINALSLAGQLKGDKGVGVNGGSSLGHFEGLQSNISTTVTTYLSGAFDIKGEELFNDENYTTGSGGDTDLSYLVSILETIADEDDGTDTSTKKGESIKLTINDCTEQIRNAVDKFLASNTDYDNNGRFALEPVGSDAIDTTGYYEAGSGTEKNYPAVSFGFQNQDEIVWSTTPGAGFDVNGIRPPGVSDGMTTNFKGIKISFNVPIGQEKNPGTVGEGLVGDNNPGISISGGNLVFELYVPLVLVCSRNTEVLPGNVAAPVNWDGVTYSPPA